MSETYNQAIAYHYSAYRPPLHQMILKYVFSGEETFKKGLDIGCGTGYSTIALSKYCLHVTGVDPSQSMLEEAKLHDKATYLKGAGEKLPLTNKSIDVVTFAGSLFYTKSDLLIKELKRVCRNQAIVVPYDFEVLLDEVLLQCGINLKKIESDYDHEINFSDCDDFNEIISSSEQVSLEITSTELAHILLADSNIYDAFVKKYCVSNPFPELVNELETTEKHHYLKVNIYFSKYKTS